MLFCAIVIGCIIGFCFAYMLIGILVCNSNDHGDSKGDINTFAENPIHIVEKNNIRSRDIP